MPTITLDTTFNNDRIPKGPITVAADNFVYADGKTLIGKTTPVGGLVWTKIIVGTPADGDIKVQGSAAGPTFATGSSNRTFAFVDVARADGEIRAQLVAGGVGAALPFRATDANNYLYVTWVNPGIWALYKRVAGTGTLVLSSSVVPAPGDVIDISAHGTLIKVSINGALAITATVSEQATATLCGIGGQAAGPISVPTHQWDNWKFSYTD